MTIAVPIAAVLETPVSNKLASPVTDVVPTLPVLFTPVTATVAFATTAIVPTSATKLTPATDVFALAKTVTLPVLPVADTPVTLTVTVGDALVGAPRSANGASENAVIANTDYPVISIQLVVASSQPYICPSVGIGTGASQRQVSSFSTHDG